MKSFKQFLKENEAHIKLRSLNNRWNRKPYDWDLVDGNSYTISEEELERMGIQPGMLSFYEAPDLWHGSVDNPTEFFDITPKEDIFLLNVPGKGNFLIRREGHDYVRYAMKVVSDKNNRPDV